jgi:hypothetical protein
MYFLNTIDEKERFLGLKFDSTRVGQSDSHTVSYLYSRKLFKEEIGHIMGFDRNDLYDEKGFVVPTDKRSEIENK